MSGLPATSLIVFAKAPVPGQAKTRLIPALGAEGAAALAERLLDHALAQGAAAGLARLVLCGTPDAAHPALARLAKRHGALPDSQGPGNLGERMHRALARGLQHNPRALLIGSDVPALDAATLRAATAALDDHDAVFVPAHDGGYALVGLKHPQPSLFQGMAWSHAQVMADTRVRARAGGLCWLELLPVHDIDEPQDLVHLPRHWPWHRATLAAASACARP